MHALLMSGDDVTAGDVTLGAALNDAVTIGHAQVSVESDSCNRNRNNSRSGSTSEHCKFPREAQVAKRDKEGHDRPGKNNPRSCTLLVIT